MHTGITDIEYACGILSCKTAKSSDGDCSCLAGVINASVAAGYYITGYTTGADYGDRDCFISNAAYSHPFRSDLSLGFILLVLTIIGLGIGRCFRLRHAFTL